MQLRLGKDGDHGCKQETLPSALGQMRKVKVTNLLPKGPDVLQSGHREDRRPTVTHEQSFSVVETKPLR